MLSRVLPLIDSGAEQSFLDSSLALAHKIPLEELECPLRANALDGSPLTNITHRTCPIPLHKICLYIYPMPQTPLVLGHPWLRDHNPQIDWAGNRILGWSPTCLSSCLKSAIPRQVSSNRIPSIIANLNLVPTEYGDLSDVFSKERAVSLPPHRPYDCAIELLLCATLPSS